MPVAQKIYRALTVLLGVVLAAVIVLRIIYEKIPRNAQSSSSEILTAMSSPLSNFTLTDQTGRPFGTADLKGKVWVADFIFTRCQGPCPLQSARMAALQKTFARAKDLRFVSFSVDPGYDTPAVLSEYAARYGAKPGRWYFLTGPTQKMYKLVREDFHLAVSQQKGKEGQGKDVTHSLSFVLVDREGKVRGYFEGNIEHEMRSLRKKIKELL